MGAINFGNAGLTINSIVQALATDDPSGLALGDGITMGFGEQDSNGDLKWGALIQALSTSTDVNLLSTPSILTLDNQEASIVVGRMFPLSPAPAPAPVPVSPTPFRPSSGKMWG